MKKLSLIFILVYSSSLFAQDINIIPYPRQITKTGTNLLLEPGSNIKAAQESLIPLADLLAFDIYKITGLEYSSSSIGAADILLEIDESMPAGEYSLDISGSIVIKGPDYFSVSHGVTSLIQIIGKEGNSLLIPELSIADNPANGFRSVMIDVARKPIDIETLVQTVEMCRLYKIPFMQIHIADDQSFCFPSTTYPELATPGHSYTLDELNALVNYATQRGVRIIPELDGPGHSTAIRKANPDVFGSTSFATLDIVSETMYEGMAILLREMMDVFHTSPYFHIGADEASLNSSFMNAEHVKSFMTANDYTGEDLQRRYVVKMDSIVKSLGYKTMAWESFKADNTHEKIKIPTDILVNAWETLYEMPQNYVKAGFDIINSSWKPYYTTRLKRWHPEYIYNFTKFSFANFWIYAPSYNPFTIAPTDQVKGGQMSCWEQLDTQIVSGLRNRIPAFSEYYWLEDERPGYADFAERFQNVDKLFEKLLTACDITLEGTNVIPKERQEWDGEQLPNPNGVQNNYQYWFKDEVNMVIRPTDEDAIVYFTTNGSEPTTSSKVWEGDLKIQTDTKVQLITFKDSIIGYQQYVFEHRPITATLKGLKEHDRLTEPYFFNREYLMPLEISFDAGNDPDVDIRYTTNGSKPHRRSTLYEGPIKLSSFESKTVRVKAFKNGMDYGSEWRPADYYDYVQYGSDRYYSFNGQDPTRNLTTDKPILGSTGYQDPLKPATMINDGVINNDNFWHSGQGFPQSLSMDLEDTYLLDRFHVWTYWADGRKYQYNIATSTDNAHWTIIVDFMDNTKGSSAAGFEHILDEPVEARYLKITVTGNSANDWSHIVELYAYEETSGIEEVTEEYDINVFPNPANDDVYVKFDQNLGPLSMEVFNESGMRLDSIMAEQSFIYQFKKKKAGKSYIFLFKTKDGKVSTKRVLKM